MDRHQDKMEEASAASASAEADTPPPGGGFGDDWVHEAVAMTRPGIEIHFPAREVDEREVPFVYDDFD